MVFYLNFFFIKNLDYPFFNMLYIPTLISIIEVILVTVPVLLTVAYVTVAERKTMASMQRRLGPNIVGLENKYLCQTKRLFHSSCSFNANPDIINFIYENRIAPVKLFDSEVIDTLYDITCIKQKDMFFNKFENQGGIYLFQFKYDKNIYYIGKTNNFKNRLNAHLKSSVKDKFHLFVNLVGWDKFEFSIIEICDLNNQQDREKFYLKKYLPILNTVFKSNFSESKFYDSLYDKLKAKQKDIDYDNKYIGISIYVYTYNNEKISHNFYKYDSINTASKGINISRFTIKSYLNTYVPYRNYLFFTDPIGNFDTINDLIIGVVKGLNINKKSAISVWAYNEKGEILYFESKEAVAKFLDVQFIMITNHVDKWIKGGINGYYLFSRELNKYEKEKLVELFSLRKTKNCKVWVYDANKLELGFNKIYGVFNSMQKAADYFNVDYRTILRHIDTKKATLMDNKLVLFVSKNLTLDNIKNLKVKNQKNKTIKLWVYRKVNSDFLLINNNEPCFNSINMAAKELKISNKTIAKYLDTNKSYNDLYFYSKKI